MERGGRWGTETERELEKMTSRIKSQPEPTHHCVNTPATPTHLTSCIQIQMPLFLTSRHCWHCCHSMPWQSGEKVGRSIIPLFTGRVRRPWPPRLNFKWITEGAFMWNVKQYGTWQAITLGDVTLSRGHTRHHCCYALLLPFARLLIDISLERQPNVAGSLWLRLDRNSIWASTCMNELGERERRREGERTQRRARERDNSFRSDREGETDLKKWLLKTWGGCSEIQPWFIHANVF